MSQWSHVAGIIRLDSLGIHVVRLPYDEKLKFVKEAIAKALGSTCDFEDDVSVWEACGVPRGSEGSLQYRIIPNHDDATHSLSWGNIIIWGDLRDFESDELSTIKVWFQESLNRLRKPEHDKNPDDMTMRDKAESMLATFSIREAVLCMYAEAHTNKQPKTVLLVDGDSIKAVHAVVK